MGIIYKIEVAGELYIGSTKKKLYKRQNNHNSSLNNPNDKNYNTPLYKFCRTHNVKKIICELIEEVENDELRILEQEYINMVEPSLNSYRAYQTKEERLEYMRLINKKSNQKKSNCPICGKEMLKHNIKKHIRRIH